MVDTIKNDLELEVLKITVIRVRKVAVEGVFDRLKEHYFSVTDFGHQVLNNP